MDKENLFSYWGKARPADPNSPAYHPLPYHCLDVAAVGEVYLKRHPRLLDFLAKKTGAPLELVLEWVRLLLFLHDLGKFSQGFQGQNPGLLKALQGIENSKASYSIRHDTLGYMAWEEWLQPELEERPLLQPPKGIGHRAWGDAWSAWMRSVTGHHGVPPDERGYDPHALALHFTEQDQQAMQEHVKSISFLLEVKAFAWDPPSNFQDAAKILSWWLAGIAVLADWLGSNTDYFPYRKPELDLPDYWKGALQKADAAISESGVLPVKPSNLLVFNDLLPHLESQEARPLQELVQRIELTPGPQLFILEDLTGSGKTEAALMLAHRMMVAGQASGLYFGLPTMATANAMYKRVGAVYERLFADNSQPSIILAHGARDLSKPFRESIIKPGEPDNDYDEDELSATTRCRAWLADNRKKALLAHVGVGTIDQALLGILYSKHQSLRLLGLFGKVLVVDEVHANDAYMHSLLKTLLEFHAAGSGSAILLSATLPKKMKTDLLEAFGKGSGLTGSAGSQSGAYPLLTHFSKAGLEEVPVAGVADSARTVTVEWLEDEEAVTQFLIEITRSGRCACWIRNTVNDARVGWLRLRAALAQAGLDADEMGLFHARFAMGDRLETEGKVLTHFGKDSAPQERSGRILVATQVVEQSLDLDFDEMVTDLAPIDLIIQRTGRLHRHLRDSAGQLIEQGDDGRGDLCLRIHGPHPAKDAEKDWYSSVFPGGAKIYPNHAQLWLTTQVLLERGGFSLPKDSRTLIENVFGENAPQTPEALESSSLRTQGEDSSKAQTGFYNSLKLSEGYSREGFDWWADAMAPTRLGEPATTLRLAKWDGTRLRPCCGGEQGWALSQVQVQKKYACEAIKPRDSVLLQEYEQAIEQLPDRGKWSLLLPLRQVGGQWVGKVLDQEGRPCQFTYDPQLGLLRDDELARLEAPETGEHND